jgi:hypothetical protein
MKLMAEKGAWLSTQPWELTDFGKPATGQEEKGKPLVGAWQRVLKLAKQYKVRVAYGTERTSCLILPGPTNRTGCSPAWRRSTAM